MTSLASFLWTHIREYLDAITAIPANAGETIPWSGIIAVWRVYPRERGLDYAGARAAVVGEGLKWRDVFGALQIMEAEVLAAQVEAA